YLIVRLMICTLAVLAVPVAQPVAAHSERVPLYNGPAPGSENWTEGRIEVVSGERRQVYNTSQPVYELHLPRPERSNGAAVVMLPGGGLRALGLGADLYDEIDALVAQGVAVLLLEYRTLQMTPDQIARASAPPPSRPEGALPARFPRMEIVNGNANPAQGNAAMDEVLRLATQDAQAALRLLHANAAQWHIDPQRIGVMGTSAGGGVAFGALLDRDAPPEEQPDFLISIYGPALQDVMAWEGAPPLFLVVEAEHGAVTDGLIEAFRIWNQAYQSAELHIYQVPNFSMTVDLWGPRLFAWMREQGIIRDR
ncbi:MAG: alpha/beta hydrolase, partial [Alteraurantiacibacter sp.]|nr:alpha/beta hydrolase [Alteraurantiacibacter sp.]